MRGYGQLENFRTAAVQERVVSPAAAAGCEGVSPDGAQGENDMLTPVGELLRIKGQALHTVTPSDPVSVAVRRMSELKIGALPVIDRGKLVGIFSERDVLVRIVDQDLDPDKTHVSEVMTPSPKTITPADRVEEAMRIMSKGRFRHLPVVDGGVLVGLISIRDAMEFVIRDQQQVIDTLISAVKKTPPGHQGGR
jgi:CBS domain-containing protein